MSQYFKNAIYIKTDKDTKKGRKEVRYYYYQLTINGRVMYLNIMENKLRKTIRLHSITVTIQTTAAER